MEDEIEDLIRRFLEAPEILTCEAGDLQSYADRRDWGRVEADVPRVARLAYAAAAEIERLREENEKGRSLYMEALNDWRSQIFRLEAEVGRLRGACELAHSVIGRHAEPAEVVESHPDADRRLEGRQAREVAAILGRLIADAEIPPPAEEGPTGPP